MIRNAQEGESSQLIALYQSFAQAFETQGLTFPVAHLYGEGLNSWIEDSLTTHCVYADGKDVWGAMYLDRIEDELYIHTLAVRADKRKTGIGRILFETALQVADTIQCKLCVESYKLFEVGGFYQKMGMELIDTLEADSHQYLVLKMPQI